MLSGFRRRAALAAAPQDDLRAFLRVAPPMQAAPPQPASEPAIEPDPPPAGEGFMFRRNVSRDFASMEVSHKRFRPAPEAETAALSPAPVEFSVIQNEVRAVLGTAPGQSSSTSHGANLAWAEPDRLAVLSLAAAAPEDGLALLRDHGITTLIAAPGHPFRQPADKFDLLSLPESADAAAPLAAKLRAKLATGEPIAFHAETALSGAAALLAARLSSRRAG